MALALPALLALFLNPQSAAFSARGDTTTSWARLEFLDLFAARLLEEWARVSEEPVDLNRAGVRDLQRIPLLSESEAGAIVRLRNSRGTFAQLSELRALGEGLYTKVAPFATIAEPRPRNVPVRIRIRASRAYRDSSAASALAGSPWKLYSRISVGSPDAVHLSVVAKKDAAEPFRYGFLSASCALRDLLIFDSVVLGDFGLALADGIVAGAPVRYGRSYDPVAASALSGARAYHSSDESGFLRGVATALRSGAFGVLTFASRRQISATMNDEGVLTSIYRTGLYTTAAELRKRNVARESLAGGSVSYQPAPSSSVALMFIYSSLSAPYLPSGGGHLFRTGGVELRGELFGMDLGGAGGFSLPGGFSWRVSTGMSAEKASIAFGYRDYSTGYINPHAGAFGEHPEAQNERGFYAGGELHLTDRLRLSAYGDLYTLPSPGRYRSGREAGYAWGATLDLALPSRGSLHCTVSGTESEEPLSGDSIRTSGRKRLRVSAGAVWTFSRRLRLFTRSDCTLVNEGGAAVNHGTLLLQELEVTLPASLTLCGRVLLYEAGAYAARLYVMEHDVPGTMSAPSFFGTGMRWYLLARSGELAGVSLSARWSGTIAHRGQSTIGAGDWFGSRNGSELSLQIDCRW